MQVSAAAFWVHKAGNSDSDYEDAFWPRQPRNAQRARFRCAVADGATEASFSKIWATQLVRAFGKCRLREGDYFETDLRELQNRWREKIDQRRPLPWYSEENVRRGAFATIVGLCLEKAFVDGAAGRWHAIAMGDSCLVQVRKEEVLVRFPLDRSEAFNNRPRLLASNPIHNKQAAEYLCTTNGTLLPGDAFFLMTDALACWFMRAVEDERLPWQILRGFDRRYKSFSEWIGKLRMDGEIQNDDVTLLRVNIA